MDWANWVTTTGAAVAGIVSIIHFIRLVQTNRPARLRFVEKPLSNGELVKATEEASRHAELKAILKHLAQNMKTLEIEQAELRHDFEVLRAASRTPRPADTGS